MVNVYTGRTLINHGSYNHVLKKKKLWLSMPEKIYKLLYCMLKISIMFHWLEIALFECSLCKWLYIFIYFLFYFIFALKLGQGIFLPHDTDIHSLKIMITGTLTLITSSITILRQLPESRVFASRICWARSSLSMALEFSFISSICSSRWVLSEAIWTSAVFSSYPVIIVPLE